jgi:hypothetical protein
MYLYCACYYPITFFPKTTRIIEKSYYIYIIIPFFLVVSEVSKAGDFYLWPFFYPNILVDGAV